MNIKEMTPLAVDISEDRERKSGSIAMLPAEKTASPASDLAYRICKGCFDFIASFFFSLILVVPMLIIALIITLKDPGNPFFLQKRVGKDGKEIRMLKFRSMRIGAENLEKMLNDEQLEEYRKEFKIKDDPRLIGYRKAGDGKRCFGAILRRTSLDELPQILYNILIKRDMSIVGPRPVLHDELVRYYTPEEQILLTSVKPGLTGYWQAFARNNASYESGQRQQMELYYIRNRSIRLDIKIMLRTVISVLSRAGAE